MSQTREIPIRQWCEMARQGAAPPVTIPLEGDSMRPLIRRGCDPVTIVPICGELRIGDVVLFTLGGRYVVHRLRKIRGDRVQTLGDHCLSSEPWFPKEQVLGRAIRYRRNGRAHRLDTRPARFFGRIWMAAFPLRRAYMRLRSLAGRCYRRLNPKKGGESHGS